VQVGEIVFFEDLMGEDGAGNANPVVLDPQWIARLVGKVILWRDGGTKYSAKEVQT
jgi:hypothetical protein